jgi:TfoX/Sxy family transcriptional regulator of competence genes
MAYDEDLAERVRDVVSSRADVTEREMFGGIAFMVSGNMACGVMGEDLIVRLGDEEARKALDEEGVRPFDFTGRPMKTTVYVSPERTRDDGGLAEWVDAGADYATSLPPKEKKMDRAPVLETRLSGVSAAFGSGQACLHHMSATA